MEETASGAARCSNFIEVGVARADDKGEEDVEDLDERIWNGKNSLSDGAWTSASERLGCAPSRRTGQTDSTSRSKIPLSRLCDRSD